MLWGSCNTHTNTRERVWEVGTHFPGPTLTYRVEPRHAKYIFIPASSRLASDTPPTRTPLRPKEWSNKPLAGLVCFGWVWRGGGGLFCFSSVLQFLFWLGILRPAASSPPWFIRIVNLPLRFYLAPGALTKDPSSRPLAYRASFLLICLLVCLFWSGKESGDRWWTFWSDCKWLLRVDAMLNRWSGLFFKRTKTFFSERAVCWFFLFIVEPVSRLTPLWKGKWL